VYDDLQNLPSADERLLLVRGVPEGSVCGNVTKAGIGLRSMLGGEGPRAATDEGLSAQKGGGVKPPKVERSDVWREAAEFCSDLDRRLGESIERVEFVAGGPCQETVAWRIKQETLEGLAKAFSSKGARP
jgi:hypothetical protein